MGKEPVRLKLGEPMQLTWRLIRQPQSNIALPEEVSLESDHAAIRIFKKEELVQEMPSFVVYTDQLETSSAERKELVKGRTTLFWSAMGFAFKEPGDYTVEIRVRWEGENIKNKYQVSAYQRVSVDAPTTKEEEKIASLLLRREVGVFVALGGDALHLKEAISQIKKAIKIDPKHPACLFFSNLPGISTGQSRTLEPMPAITKKSAKKEHK